MEHAENHSLIAISGMSAAGKKSVSMELLRTFDILRVAIDAEKDMQILGYSRDYTQTK